MAPTFLTLDRRCALDSDRFINVFKEKLKDSKKDGERRYTHINSDCFCVAAICTGFFSLHFFGILCRAKITFMTALLYGRIFRESRSWAFYK